ncbi:MAG: DUF1207 domain-containing protein, partial [Gammaproteobacteria bacterium]
MRRFVTSMSNVILIAAVLSSSLNSSTAAASRPDDRYLAGYAAAILEMRFGLTRGDLAVENGRLALDPTELEGHNVEEVLASLDTIEGLEVTVAEALTGGSDAPKPVAEATLPTTAGWLPKAALFEPLIADPRWPHFSGTVQFYQDDDELGTVGAANLGAALPLYGWRGMGLDWQVGLHAGVFSIFDLNEDSSDLVNSDFLGGVPLDARYGPVSAQLRIFHQSSHLGDEFLLRNRVNRINLSYEAVDLKLSLKPLDWLRVYAGGGAIIRSEPDLDTWSAQGGIEISGPGPLFHPLLYPVLALDVQSSE